MKPRLVLAGLGHGQLELLDRLDALQERYEVVFIGSMTTIYTGAFPQVLAGLMDSATVPLPNVSPVANRVLSIDPDAKRVMTEIGPVPYDKLVLSTGAQSRGTGLRLKPMTSELIELIQASERLSILGGGKAGVELAFVCVRSKAVTLYAPEILPELPTRSRKQIERQLVASGVNVIKQKRVHVEDELVLDATGIVSVEWWAESGLADSGAFIPTDAYLRQIDYPEIFVTGDMAEVLNGGVDAVRSGKYVAAQLLGETQRPFRQRQSMNILLTTPGKALLTFDSFTWHGRLPYVLKRFIDRNYIRRFKRSEALIG